MWELDCEEGWAPKNWFFWSVVLEKALESPLDCKEIQPVRSEGDQPWDFFGRNDAKAETPVLWPPYAKSWLIGKDPDAGKEWGQEKKGTTEDEMAGWHHQLHGHGFGWILGVGDGQWSLVWCNSWCGKESDTTEQLNWTEVPYILIFKLWTFKDVNVLREMTETRGRRINWRTEEIHDAGNDKRIFFIWGDTVSTEPKCGPVDEDCSRHSECSSVLPWHLWWKKRRASTQTSLDHFFQAGG